MRIVTDASVFSFTFCYALHTIQSTLLRQAIITPDLLLDKKRNKRVCARVLSSKR